MTIRDLQYAIQHAIDSVPGITDDAEVCVSDNAIGCEDFWDGKKQKHVFGELTDGCVQLSPLQIATLNEIAGRIYAGDYGIEEMDDLTDTEMNYRQGGKVRWTARNTSW